MSDFATGPGADDEVPQRAAEPDLDARPAPVEPQAADRAERGEPDDADDTDRPEASDR